MRVRNRKLTVARETLRGLTSHDLERAGGAASGFFVPPALLVGSGNKDCAPPIQEGCFIAPTLVQSCGCPTQNCFRAG